MTAGTIVSDDLAFLLSLVAREREARNSPLWKTNTDAAIEEHGAACDAVFAELYRMHDRRPVEAAKPPRPEQIKRMLKREMKRELKSVLSHAIDSAVSDL